MIELKEVSFSYRSKKLFDNVSFHLEKGHVYGLLGKNGAGKTTLIKNITGLLFPSSGEIYQGGKKVCSRYPEVLADIFYVPEEFDISNVKANTFAEEIGQYYPHYDHSKFSRCISRFDVNADDNLGAMSFGQRKKVMLSLGLASNTPYLILDEPTNALDIPSKSQLRKLLTEAVLDDQCVLISTHQIKDLNGIFDHVIMIDDGKVILNESLSDTSQKYCFGLVKDIDPSKVIFSEKTMVGEIGMYISDGQQTEVDLEILFNALTQGKLKL